MSAEEVAVQPAEEQDKQEESTQAIIDVTKTDAGAKLHEVKILTGKEKMKVLGEGLLANIVSGAILFCIAYFLELHVYVFVALAMQYATFFFHALPFSSEKYYDISGSVTHFAVVLTSLLQRTQIRTPRQIMAALCSVLWMTRLGSFLYLRIKKDGKDERFDAWKQVFITWLSCWTTQATWVMTMQLPVILINDRLDTTPLMWSDYVAFVCWIIGFVTEASADNEKFCFRAIKENRHKFIQQGIWRYSRHPNYFGEITMWTSLAFSLTFVAQTEGKASTYYAWIAPGFSAFLLLFVGGVPAVEKAGQEKWGHLPEYQHYTKGTSCLIPWFPAKKYNEVAAVVQE